MQGALGQELGPHKDGQAQEGWVLSHLRAKGTHCEGLRQETGSL